MDLTSFVIGFGVGAAFVAVLGHFEILRFRKR
jgi:hypothetical protein